MVADQKLDTHDTAREDRQHLMEIHDATEMNQARGPGIIHHTEDAPGARRCCGHEPIRSGPGTTNSPNKTINKVSLQCLD